ncbi:MAG: hypothetical protein IJS60_05050 [Abditibacteriota bacterium]|nr:hypothetical protein [Abditibacteriota bacterium]
MIDFEKLKIDGESYKIFKENCFQFYTQELSPNEYVDKCYKKISSLKLNNRAIKGKIFKLIIISLLMKEDISPIYIQANVSFVPNVVYDLVLYSENNYPVSLSLKISFKGKYKLADLEAVALKYVHRRAESYLITMDDVEAKSVSNKIKTGSIMGLNDVLVANSSEFNDFIFKIKEMKFIKPGKIDIISSEKIIEL